MRVALLIVVLITAAGCNTAPKAPASKLSSKEERMVIPPKVSAWIIDAYPLAQRLSLIQ